MDNGVTIPGYKYYLDADDRRPDVCVAFLDVVQTPGAWVNGLCVPVDEAALRSLDHRERNYERVDVTRAVEPTLGRTWVYAGRPDSRSRFAEAAAEGRCVVQRAYADLVERGFRELGQWEAFEASTSDGRPPLRDLRRVDLP
jgi:hypothetical protein